MIFISYFHDPRDGVGSMRSRFLSEYLTHNKIDIYILSKSNTPEIFSKNILLWAIYCFFIIIRSKSKKIYVSCGPFVHLPLIVLASIITRKELIVDFRDPWSFNIASGYGGKKNVNNKKLYFAQFIEKCTYKYCKYFIVCTPGLKKKYTELFGSSKKILLILNGHNINSEKIKPIIKNNNQNELSFVCLGKFSTYNENKAYKTLKEIKDFKSRNKDLSIRIEFIGEKEKKTEEIVKQLNLGGITTFTGKLDYNAALSRAVRADIGLCNLRDEDLEFGTKVFDYIGLGIPIFDCFNEGSEFKEFFDPYLTKFTKRRISLEDSMSFHRRKTYEDKLYVFKNLSGGKNNEDSYIS